MGNKRAVLPRFSFIKPTNRQVERHLNLRLLPLLVAILFILYILTGYRGWLIFLIGIAGAWLTAAVWIFSLERSLWIDRKIHQAWAAVGNSVPERLMIQNQGWLPALWVEITDTSPTEEAQFRLVTDVTSRSSRTRHQNHLFKRRGLYSLGPTTLRCGDPFGIYSLTILDRQASSILITPPILPLNQIKLIPGGLQGNENRRRGVFEHEVSEGGLREYTPGDSLRYIHWPASSHFNQLIVRELESAQTRDLWIFADLERSIQAGTGLYSTLELVIVIAASLAVRALKEHLRVGLTFAGPQFTRLEPSSGPAQQWQILRALAMADAGEFSLANLLSYKSLPKNALKFYITPSVDPDWTACLSRSTHNGNGMAILINPHDFDPLLPLNSSERNKIISRLDQQRITHYQVAGELLAEAYAINHQKGQKKHLPVPGMDDPRFSRFAR